MLANIESHEKPRKMPCLDFIMGSAQSVKLYSEVLLLYDNENTHFNADLQICWTGKTCHSLLEESLSCKFQEKVSKKLLTNVNKKQVFS